MESTEEINRALAEMGEPPLQGDVVQASPPEHAELAPATAEADAEAEGGKRIELVEPPGHRRANLFFLNGRVLFIDMQDDELLQTIRDFLKDRNPDSEFLTLPLVDKVGEGKNEVVVAAPIHLARKQLELLSSVGRSWMPKVPGEASAESKVEIVRGSEAAAVLHLSREQRRRMARQSRG